MKFDATQEAAIVFGPFELRPGSGELRREGVAIKLPPQPFKVLQLLVEKHGQLVLRRTLQEKIWGTETFVDFDKGLNLCIAQIREALGDNAQSPIYIETLPRRGYRFIGEIGGKAVESISNRLPGSLAKNRVRATVIALLICVLVLAIAVTGFYLRSSRSGSAKPAKETKFILLVLPFENLAADPAQEYFSDGLTEEMITRLGSLQPSRLGVIARTTALTYKNTKKTIRQIGDELGVNYVLEGSVRRESGRIRITSQLIEVDGQTHIWAESYDRDEKDVLGIQREVATQIASSLRLQLFPNQPSDVESARSTRPEAYDAYLKGRYLITKDTPEDLERSVPYFEQATNSDPDFAPAYAAWVEALVLQTDWTGKGDRENLPKAKAAALRAIELDPSFAEGYAALGSVQLWLEWDPSAAEPNFKRAVELNPNNPLTRINYGRCLLVQGNTEMAVGQINEALRLDPVSLLTTGLAAYARLEAGHYEEAIGLSNRMLELEPNSWAARECLFRSYVNKGDYPSALAVTRDRMTRNGEKAEDIRHLDDGDPKSVLEDLFKKKLAQMKASVEKGEKVWMMHGAWLSVKIGDKDAAFEWLERALGDHQSFVLYLEVDPVWDPIKNDARFEALKLRTQRDTR